MRLILFEPCRGQVKVTAKVTLTFASPQDFLKYSSKAGLDCDQIEVTESKHDNNRSRIGDGDALLNSAPLVSAFCRKPWI